MKFHRVNQVHLVSLLGELEGIHPGSAAYVKNYCRCRRKMPSDDGPGTNPLEFTTLTPCRRSASFTWR